MAPTGLISIYVTVWPSRYQELKAGGRTQLIQMRYLDHFPIFLNSLFFFSCVFLQNQQSSLVMYFTILHLHTVSLNITFSNKQTQIFVWLFGFQHQAIPKWQYHNSYKCLLVRVFFCHWDGRLLSDLNMLLFLNTFQRNSSCFSFWCFRG